jgi:hypothetical protein
MLTALLAAFFVSFASLQPHVPEGEKPKVPASPTRYFCPMKCEGDKTYDDPSVRCPVCRMRLKPVPVTAPAPAPALTLSSPNPQSIKPGETLTLTFVAARKDAPLEGYELAITSADLRWLQHVPAGPDSEGKRPVRAALPAPGVYKAALVAVGKTLSPTGITTFELPGDAPAPAAFPAPGSPIEVGDGFEVVPVTARLPVGKEGRLEFRLVRDGKPFPLSLAKANAMRVIVFSDDLAQGAVLRPETDQTGVPKFPVTLPRAGLYRALVHFEEAGQPHTGLCTIEAR